MVTALFIGALISLLIGFFTYAIVDIWLMGSKYSYETDKINL